ncbi:hypothetical protein FB451DRAFT_1172882 [Mycena latifolia]|nr:hypothetical protein FB451DRAFT_1172882 [Mycena latifolia]
MQSGEVADTSFAYTDSTAPCPVEEEESIQYEEDGGNAPTGRVQKTIENKVQPDQKVILPDVHPKSDWKMAGALWYRARFVQRHQRRGKQFNENLPVDITHSRKFCSEIKDIRLTAEQIGRICLPLYMKHDSPEHENPTLTAIFNTALPRAAKILAEFDGNRPVVRDFNEHFCTKKPVQRHREAGQWMQKLGLAVTLELEATLTEPQLTLLKLNEVTPLKEPERYCRVMSVGSVLLQRLAIQTELGEPLNLNSELVADLRDRAVVACLSDGVEALDAMFTAAALSAKKALKHMLQFNRAHTVYDADFRSSMYRRDNPSYSESTGTIPIFVKRRGAAGNYSGGRFG